ncbi:MAG: thioredoxin domain-containing protein [Myxococcota bacterium]
MTTQIITGDNLEQTIQDHAIVVLDFWASWCGPCRAFGPVFEAASERHEGIVFGKVNTEQEQELAAALGIRSIPTVMVFRDQVLLYNRPGALPAGALEELLEQVQQVDMEKVRAEIAAHHHEDHEHAHPNH